MGPLTDATTGERYRRFADIEARDESPCFADWAAGVANDSELLELIDELPQLKRQPNLVFAAARFAGIEPGSFAEFRAGLIAQWPQIRSIASARRTQTNEVGRCAVLLPLLAALPQPLALLELGTSAGLCLYPDRFSYQYGDRPRLDPPDGRGAVLHCATQGPVPIPSAVPEIVWRAGIDLNPLQVCDPADVQWLETLVWPGQSRRPRLAQLAAAVEIARANPPLLVGGDAGEKLPELLAQAPRDATLVVFHSAMLMYLEQAARTALIDMLRALPGHWISNEGLGVVPFPESSLPPSPEPSRVLAVLAHGERPVAYADGHGRELYWFGSGG